MRKLLISKPTHLFLILGYLNLLGCSGSMQSCDTSPTTHTTYQLQRTVSPSVVCQQVLEAVDRGDRESVLNLLAEKRIAADVQAITKGRSVFKKLGKGTEAAAASIILDLKILQPAHRKILGETVTNDQAEVKIVGHNAEGDEITKSVRFVREEGSWKIVPSHR